MGSPGTEPNRKKISGHTDNLDRGCNKKAREALVDGSNWKILTMHKDILRVHLKRGG